MKRKIHPVICVFGASLLIWCDLMAFGQTVRIAAVRNSNAVNIVEMEGQMDAIIDAFQQTPGVTVSIDLVNGGIAFPLTTNIVGSTLGSRHFSAFNNASLKARRNDKSADLIVAFVESLPGGSGTQTCGWAPMPYWQTGLGVLPPTPDRRGQETYYIALVSNASSCNNVDWSEVFAAHEVGHLFGAGHRYGLFNGLVSGQSYGDYLDPNVRPGNQGARTVMSIDAVAVTDCATYTCFDLEQFSSSQTESEPPSFTSSFSNAVAINLSGSSVAVYREPCSLAIPNDLGGYIEDICYGGQLGTRHRVHWDDSCPDESDSYNLYYRQPTLFSSLRYLGKVFSASTTVEVTGDGSFIFATACDGLNCTTYDPSDLYYAEWVECH